jgi:spore coat protein U-like protein
LLLLPAILLACALRAGPALALGETCSVGATSLAFGAFAPLSGTVLDATATITVTCSCTLACVAIRYTVAVSAGGSATYTPRRMNAGGLLLPYNGYDSSGRTTIWGDGSGSTSIQTRCRLLSLGGPPWVEPITFYGRIPVNTAAAPGSYSDNLTVTVTYNGLGVCL